MTLNFSILVCTPAKVRGGLNNCKLLHQQAVKPIWRSKPSFLKKKKEIENNKVCCSSVAFNPGYPEWGNPWIVPLAEPPGANTATRPISRCHHEVTAHGAKWEEKCTHLSCKPPWWASSSKVLKRLSIVSPNFFKLRVPVLHQGTCISYCVTVKTI